MKWKTSSFWLRAALLTTVALLVALGMSGCGASKPTPTAVAEAVATSTEAAPATATPAPSATFTTEPTATATPEPTATYTPPPTSTNTPAPTSTNTPAPTPTPVDNSNCITCHTSEDTLKALAKEPEEGGESLSEGEG